MTKVCLGKLVCVNYQFIVIILGLVVGVLVWDRFNKKTIKHQKQPSSQKNKFPILGSRKVGGFFRNMFNPDFYKRIYDPLAEPVKSYSPTRVEGKQPYQSLGYVYRSESSADYNPEGTNQFPLYGRRDYRNTNKFEYYVMIGGIKVVLSQTSELYSDDTVSLPGYNGSFTASVYENEQIEYNPNLF